MLVQPCLSASLPERPIAAAARRGALALLLACAVRPAKAAPRAQLPDNLQGREVWSMDETPIGTIIAKGRNSAPSTVMVAPVASLGIGITPLTIPLSLLREASEGRLLLIMGPGEFHATVAAAGLGRR
ncbi:hypothetical protein [Teichococcus coralli]|uniref:hypothetical protein n=1 Tax=Teichococcus coralli TaxID=2545983 RepID=UPI0013702671|nr:hypothetical protein [Pseudoroseomonas coralli]